jgi:hypothetical protein
MGLRNWFRRFVSKVKELLGVYDKYSDYKAEAHFPDGSSAVYLGKPWGWEFELFKEMAREEAYGVSMNMTGSYWRF